MLDYRLRLQQTEASTGYFTAVPDPGMPFARELDYLVAHPNDSFMHAHLLERLGRMDIAAVRNLLDARDGALPAVEALFLEAASLHAHLAGLGKDVDRREMSRLATATPLIFLKSQLLPDQACHRSWSKLFHANLFRHRPLPPLRKTGLAVPVANVGGSTAAPATAHLKAVAARLRREAAGDDPPRRPPQDTIDNVLPRVEALDLLDGPEMRHESSLSPIALLRQWRFANRIQSGMLAYTFAGTQTAYGRGLSLADARAACLMEVVERASAFAGIDDSGVAGTLRPHPLLYGTHADLTRAGYPLLDPNHLRLEVPYRDEPLYWIEGEQLTACGFRAMWVPAQCVFLFCNLDERSLFSGLGSSGLASGNTVAEARLSALYELIERDSQAVNPFHPSRCFRVYSEDDAIQALLEDFRARGIQVQFQDISPDYGIPCCTAFVTHRDGTLAMGAGASLDGKRAVLSALTEVPYPYPMGPPSAPAQADLPWLAFETLPDFSTGRPGSDLALVEQTLLANGYAPIYVEMTREDLGIPVVRALIPGFELMNDFDEYSRISTRLFNNYLNIHRK